MSLAWHIAALGRIKKFPELKTLMAKTRPQKPVSSNDLEAVKAWVRSVGGKVLTRH